MEGRIALQTRNTFPLASAAIVCVVVKLRDGAISVLPQQMKQQNVIFPCGAWKTGGCDVMLEFTRTAGQEVRRSVIPTQRLSEDEMSTY